MMSILKLLIMASVLSCFALPAMAQADKGGSYHYSGGPKSEVPYHPGRKKSARQRNPAPAGATIILAGPNPKCPITSGPRRIDWKAPPPRDRFPKWLGPKVGNSR